MTFAALLVTQKRDKHKVSLSIFIKKRMKSANEFHASFILLFQHTIISKALQMQS